MGLLLLRIQIQIQIQRSAAQNAGSMDRDS